MTAILLCAGTGCWKQSARSRKRAHDVNDPGARLGLLAAQVRGNASGRFPKDEGEFLKDADRVGLSAEVQGTVRSGSIAVVYCGPPVREISKVSPNGGVGQWCSATSPPPSAKGGPVLSIATAARRS